MSFDRWAADLADHLAQKQKAASEPACDTCDDEGWCWTMACYGGPPIEIKVHCVDCGGRFAGEPWDD